MVDGGAGEERVAAGVTLSPFLPVAGRGVRARMPLSHGPACAEG